MSYRSVIGHGTLVKNEAEYGQGSAFSTAADGAQCVEPPTLEVAYTYEGERPAPPGTAGRQALASPVGEHCSGSIACEIRGAGVAYTSSITPPNIHALLRASGFSAAFDSGAWTYTPTPISEDYATAALRVYTRTERLDVVGALCDYEISSEDGAPLRISFEFQGLPTAPVNEPLPAITYNSTLPPSATNIGFQWGSVTGLVVRSLQLTGNREIAPRLDINAADGHAGFAAGRREPSLNIVVESTDLTNFNPYEEKKQKTVVPFSFQVGSEVGNRFTVSGNAQVMNVQREEDGPVATWNIEIAIVNTTPFANDDLAFVLS